jgi:N-carbamoylputrescine amidase
MHLTIALLQMTACGNDQTANQAKGEAFCRQARAMGADIALFPEMWNIGFTPANPPPPGTPDLWQAPECWQMAPAPVVAPSPSVLWQGQAISRDDPFITHFQALAKELQMAIALTYLEQWPGAPRNSMSLIDLHGKLVMTYAKVHTCDFDPVEAALSPGDDFYVCPLETKQGTVNVGSMICYDREFPESARILMLKGAEIILVPNACHLDSNSLAQFRTRAYENVVGLAMTNYAAPQNNGHSIAFNGIHEDEQRRAHDMLLIKAGESEGIYLATFDLGALRAHRLRHTGGNAFRRPHHYHLLTALDIEPPYVRVNAQGERYNPSCR